jgi:hypothetical protein
VIDGMAYASSKVFARVKVDHSWIQHPDFVSLSAQPAIRRRERRGCGQYVPISRDSRQVVAGSMRLNASIGRRWIVIAVADNALLAALAAYQKTAESASVTSVATGVVSTTA